ncbi:hypothetical protein [Sphaerochaeta pleomorpha]|uniref:hypothetical protein n=1 Tax=Sphaerochaeta pleomorpha TaxID=1131707 RepID=UPI001FDF8A89|nr:hypothetical protein [Sphaerochaeta pleomorpha]
MEGIKSPQRAQRIRQERTNRRFLPLRFSARLARNVIYIKSMKRRNKGIISIAIHPPISTILLAKDKEGCAILIATVIPIDAKTAQPYKALRGLFNL